jgi:PKD repeat protein
MHTAINDSACSGELISFSASSAGLTYSWNFGDPSSGSNNTSNSQNPSHSFRSIGCSTNDYTVSLSTTNSYQCSNNSQQILHIKQRPEPFLTGNFQTCNANAANPNTLVTVQNFTTETCISSYIIDWGDGTTPEPYTPPFPSTSHIYTSLGSFNLIFSATNTNGCEGDTTIQVIIESNPQVSITKPGNTSGCSPQTYQFSYSNYATGNVSPSSTFLWDFGDGTTVEWDYNDLITNNGIITHTYNSSSCGYTAIVGSSTYHNSFMVTLSVMNSCYPSPSQPAASASAAPIYICTGASPSFTMTPQTKCTNSSITFTNTTDISCLVNNPPQCYTSLIFFWDFGDGTPIVPQTSVSSTTHTFSNPGIYTVKLSAKNDCDSITISEDICVGIANQIDFTLSQNTGCYPLEITCTPDIPETDLCNNPTFQWSVTFNNSGCPPTGGGYHFITDPNIYNPTISFDKPGLYTISLIVQSNCGTAVASNQITVKTVPKITIQPITPICENDSINPSATFQSCYGTLISSSYSWNFAGGEPNIINSQNPGYITYSNSGTYQIIASADNECGTGSDNINVTIIESPDVIIDPPSLSICSGESTNISLTSSLSGTDFSWTVTTSGVSGASGGSGNSIIQPLTTTTLSNGTATYIITPQNSNGCTGEPDTVVVTVKPNPSVSFTSGSQFTSICSGEQTNISFTADISGSTFSWEAWSPSGNVLTSSFSSCSPPQTCSSPIQQSPELNPNIYVNGTVKYAIRATANGCQGDTIHARVLVKPIPDVSNDPLSKSICSGENTNIHLQSNVSGTSFNWIGSQTGGVIGVSGLGNSQYIQDDLSLSTGSTSNGTATYNIEPQANGCIGDPVDYVVTVKPLPVITLDTASQTVCAGENTIPVNFSSSLGTSTSYYWEAQTSVPPGATPSTTSGTTSYIPSLTINSSLDESATISFIITPTTNQCEGDPITHIVTVNPAPSVEATPSSPQTVCSEEPTTPIHFTSNVSGATFSWTAVANPSNLENFDIAGTGDIPSQSIVNPNTSPGTVTYTITSNYSGGGMNCPGQELQYVINVLPVPDVIPSTTSQTICSGETTDITLQSNLSGTSFTWIVSTSGVNGASGGFGDSIVQPLTTTGLSNGTATYIITPQNTNGCTGEPDTVVVTVKPNPSVAFTAGSQFTSICSGDQTNISFNADISGSTLSWEAWSPSGNVLTSSFSSCSPPQTCSSPIQQSPELNPNIYVNGTVKYAIRATANGCQGDTIHARVLVKPIPDVSNDPLSKSICSGENTNIHLQSNVSGTSFNWIGSQTGGVIGVSGLGNSQYIQDDLSLSTGSTSNGTATYNIEPQANGCIGDPVDYVVTVKPLPVITLDTASQTVCAGENTIPVNFSSSLGTSTSYYWEAQTSVPPGATPSTTSGTTSYIPSLTINSSLDESATISFIITPTTNQCEGDPITHIVTVNPAPSVEATPSSPQTVCSEEPTTPIHFTSNVSGATFSWTAVANPSNLENFDIAGTGDIPSQSIVNPNTSPGTVTYTITSNYSGGGISCPGQQIQYVINVLPVPQLIATNNSPEICSDGLTNISLSSNLSNPEFTWSVSQTGNINGLEPCPSNCQPPPIEQNLSLNQGIWTSQTATYNFIAHVNGCESNDTNISIIVKPLPNVLFNPTSTAICSDNEINIQLSSNVSTGVSYTWTASLLQGNAIGFSNGTGNIINQTLINTGNETAFIRYAVIANANSCDGDSIYHDVTVFPVPQIANTSLDTSICSGQPAGIALTSNVTAPAATFSWTATSPTPGFISGYSNASGSIINQTLTNTGTTDGTVIYTVTASANGCDGPEATFTVTVHPVPHITYSQPNQEVCPGEPTLQVDFSSSVSEPPITTYHWTAAASDPGITGFDPEGFDAYISSQTIANSLTTQGWVTFTITPTANGCDGPDTTYTITVNPAPSVTNTPLEQTRCSGVPTTPVTLTANVSGTTFEWTATASSPDIEGFETTGTATIPQQTITNSGTTTGHVTYTIIPSSPGSVTCPGDTAEYNIYIKPLPNLTMNPVDTAICAQTNAIINLSSSITGTSYTWTTAQTGGVTGLSNCDGSGTPCGDQIDQMLALQDNTWTPGTATYTITPNYDGCDGPSGDTSIIIKPLPDVIFIAASNAICNNTTTNIALSTHIPTGATYSWTAQQVVGTGIQGFNDDTGDLIAQTLINNSDEPGVVRYYVTATAQGCSSAIPDTFDVTVYPVPDVSNNPMDKAICSNTSTNLPLTSNVTGTSFSWTAACPDAFISGYSDDNGLVIDQTLINTGDVDGIVTYTITPTANGCPGNDTNYLITVHPVPIPSCDTNAQEICSGTSSDPVILTSTVAGTSFAWTAVASPATGLTGFNDGTGSPIAAQTITSSLVVPGTVTYTVTTEANGCTGQEATHVITVNPAPGVTNTPLYDSICSGGTSAEVVLTANVTGAWFTWTAVASSTALSGFDASGGDTIHPQTITNTDVVPHHVTYSIVPHFTGSTSCAGETTDYVITVAPKPQITSVLFDSVCSDNPFSYTLTSSVASSTFNWSRVPVTGITPATASGNTALIEEILHNSTSNDINVTYQVVATGPYSTACQSNPTNLVVRVKDYFVAIAEDTIEIPHGIRTYLYGSASGGGGNLYYTWQPQGMIYQGLHNDTAYTRRIYNDTTFYFTVTDLNMTNCDKQDSVRVVINGSALAVMPTIDPELVCPGGDAQLFANPSGGSGTYVSFTWTCDPPGTPVWTSSLENPWINPEVPTTYHVIVDDGFNTANGSVSISIKDPPVVHSVTGGGLYCANGTGVTIGLDGTTLGDTYTLYDPNGNPAGTISGTGNPMSFGNTYMTPGIYTAQATSTSLPQCTIDMDSSATVGIIPLPIPYQVTGGGSYSQGGSGLPIGLANSQLDVAYELLHEDTSFIPPLIEPGTGSAITFGNQTLAGTYTVIARTNTDPVCENMMLDSAFIIINPWPTVYKLMGGGDLCADDSTGVEMWLEDSEIGVTYRLFRNGIQYGDTVVGDDDSIFFCYTNKAGIYYANGTNQITGLMKYMDDTLEVVVHPLPLVYTMGSYGDDCPGTEIMLNGSQTGINYELRLNTNPVVTLAGTGSPLNFGPVFDPGIYDIRAYDTTTGCDTLMNNPITINPAPLVFNLYPIGVSCAGDTVWLSGSELGIKYQLQRDGTFNVGAPRDGTGDTLNFGPQTVPGLYTVLGFNPLTNCNTLMNGEAEINPVPDPYTIVPSGDTCAGTSIGLSGSQLGVKYILKRDTLWLDTLNGTGYPIEFGPQTQPGIYTIVGYDTTTYKFCSALMPGSVTIHPNPIPYQITPMGYSCAGDSIGLMDSDIGVVYQLIRDGSTAVGPLVAGTGGQIYFGIQTIPGTYTIIGKYSQTNCWGDMTGSTVLNPTPNTFIMIPTGDTCAGAFISLNGSQTGVDYTLIRDGIPVLTMAGTGTSLPFGAQTIAGTYSIRATNSTPDSCDKMMTGSLQILNAPEAFNLTPTDSVCTGNSLILDDSEVGVAYQLFLNTTVIDTLYGTGNGLNFGPQYLEGAYSVLGIDTTTGCHTYMTGITWMFIQPTQYSLVPQGDTCEHIPVGLNGSDLNINYILKRDGVIVEIHPGTGAPFTFNYQTTAGTYTVLGRSTTSDSCVANMLGSLVIHPLPLAIPLMPPGQQCEPQELFFTQTQAGVAYRLIKDGAPFGPWIPAPSGGGYLSMGSQLAGTYQAIGRYATTYCADTMANTVVITGQPVPIPGNDTSVCYGYSINLYGDTTWASAIHWVTRGDGSFNNPNIPDPTYTPGLTDLANGSVWIILEATGLQACNYTVNRDSLLLTIDPLPIADAGPDDVICEGTLANLTGDTLHASSMLWSTSGDGTFGDETTPVTTYDPGVNDIANGTVTLRLTTYGNLACSDTVYDEMTLTIEPLPVANAGPNDTICENDTYTLSGADAMHASGITWTTFDGTGLFVDPNIVQATYQPSVADIALGTIQLVLTADGSGTCSPYTHSDTMQLTFHLLPIIDAGVNDTICSNGSFPLDLSSATIYASLQWTAPLGDGTFDAPDSLHPIYYPGTADTANGSVWLYLTAWGTGYCTGETTTDSLQLFFHPMPVALAGTDIDACPNEPVYTDGDGYNATGPMWGTTGDGSFTDPALYDAEYLPGVADKANGSVKLYLTVNGTDQCISQTHTDTVDVLFRPLPSVQISGMDTICEDDTAFIEVTFTGMPPFSIAYTDGTNTDTITNIIVNPYPFAVSPVATTNYAITWVHDLWCEGNILPGTATVFVNPAPFAFAMTTSGGGSYCQGGDGVALGLTGSELGVQYTLYRDGNPFDTTFPGTGFPLPFGNYTTPGIYSVYGIDTTTELSCGRAMADSITVTVNPMPVVDFLADSTCKGDSTQFILTGPDIGKIALWFWEFGDGTTATYTNPENPMHLYPVVATYTVTLTATDTNGCERVITHIVNVSELPVALFSVSQTTCQTFPVAFYDASYSIPPATTYLETWIWDFGDGTYDTIYYPANPDVTHQYANQGTFLVTLTVINNKGCAAQTSEEVTVLPNPVADFTYSTTQCANQPVQFTDATQTGGSGTIATWSWNFGDPASGVNNTSSLQNPTHNYATSASYLVTLFVESNTGCTDSTTHTISIEQSPVADFTVDTACFGSTTTFTDNSTPNASSIITYSWDFGDGTPQMSGPGPHPHTYAVPGIYYATLHVVNSNFCEHDTMHVVTVLEPPTAGFWTTAPACVGSPVDFNDESTTQHGYIEQWHWNFGDGNDTTINFPANQNVTHSYTQAGTYPAMLTITTSDGCSDSLTVMVDVNNNPIANFDHGEGCAEQAVQFTDLSSINNGGAIMSWSWNFGDPGSGVLNYSNLQNPSHVYNYAGIYLVELTVVNVDGCSSTITDSVTIHHLPSARFVADSACYGYPTHFTDSSLANSGTVVIWNWDFGDGTPNSSLQNPEHTYSAPGTYWVTLTVSNSEGCESDTTQEVLVKEPPDAQFTFENNCQGLPTQFTDQSVTFVGWLTAWFWDFGDDSTSTLQNPEHIYASAGTYDVKLIVTNSEGCIDSITHQVLIHQGPTSDFTYNSYYCPAGQVDFQSLAVGNGGSITDYLWTFENGYTSNIPNPTYTFLYPDSTYAVSLAVTDEYGCTDVYTDSAVFVNPAFAFTMEADTACFGIPTQFHAINLASGDSLMSVIWYFNDPPSGSANTSTLHNPTHLYTAPGTYIVKLVAWNSEDCVDSVFREIRVEPTPVANFGFVSLPCDSIIQFVDSTQTAGLSIASWTWDFGDGTPPITILPPNSPDTSHPYSDQGLYEVSLTVTTTHGCSDTITKTVQRYPCIISSFVEIGAIQCEGQQILFLDSSEPIPFINDWAWFFGDGTDTTYTIHADTIAHTYDTAGIYQVQLVISGFQNGSLFYDTASMALQVLQAPVANFSTFNVCLNDTAFFLNTTTTFVGDSLSYHWQFGYPTGNPVTSTLMDPAYLYPEAGTWPVTLAATNTLGCTDTTRRDLRVYGLPQANFEHALPCERHDIQFTDITIPADTTINYWYWNFGDPDTRGDTSLLQNPTYRYDSISSYPVFLLTEDHFGCQDTTLKTIKILPSPISEFDFVENFEGLIGQLKFINLSTNAIYYFWDFGNNQYSEEEEPVVAFEEDGTYRIYLLTENEVGCTDTTFYNYTLLFRGLYIPNAFAPTGSETDLQTFLPKGTNLKSYHIIIFDQWGDILFESTKLTPDGEPDEGWDGTDSKGTLLPQGTYVWKIEAEFEDGTIWQGSYNGRIENKTIGTVTLLR